MATYIAPGIRGACLADSAHGAGSVVRGHDPVGIRESRQLIQGAQLPRFCHCYRPWDRHGHPGDPTEQALITKDVAHKSVLDQRRSVACPPSSSPPRRTAPRPEFSRSPAICRAATTPTSPRDC